MREPIYLLCAIGIGRLGGHFSYSLAFKVATITKPYCALLWPRVICRPA